MYYKLPVKERMDLMKSYRKANPDMSYRDMVNDYNTSYEKFSNSGKKEINLNLKNQESNIPLSTWNQNTDWLGEKYNDIGLNFNKNNLNIGIGNYVPRSTFEKVGNINPYLNVNYNLNDKSSIGGSFSKDYNGISFIQKFGNGGKVPFMKNESDKIVAQQKMLATLKPRDYATEKTNYETQTRGTNQMDGSGISSAELAYKYAKLIDPSGITSVTEIAKNAYNKDKQDPFDYLGLIKIPYVQQGMKQLPKLTKQINKLSLINKVVTKSHDLEESYK